MNLKISIMKRIVFFISLLAFLHAESDLFYGSPGFRIGYNKDRGFDYSFQVTFGCILEKFGRNVPGITIGITQINKCKGFYADLQIGRNLFFDIYEITNNEDFKKIPIFSGIGIGKLIYQHKTGIRAYNRVKVWTGSISLLTYECNWSSKYDNFYSYGGMGVFPLPLTDWQP